MTPNPGVASLPAEPFHVCEQRPPVGLLTGFFGVGGGFVIVRP